MFTIPAKNNAQKQHLAKTKKDLPSHSMNFELCTITPQYALELLKKNSCNRPLNKSNIEFFEEQIKRGEFLLTHQSICISSSGRLLDGQHRCHAIVNTGIPIEIWIATGFDDKTFAVLDSGCKRTAANAIAISDSNSQNHNIIAAAVRLRRFFYLLPNHVWIGNNAKTSHTEILKSYQENPEAWCWAAKIANRCTLANVIAPSPAAALIFIATQDNGWHRSYLEGFFLALKSGADLSPHHPLLVYRNKQISGVGQLGHASAQKRLADYIKLFNAVASNQRLAIFKSQDFPPMPKVMSFKTDYR